MMHQGRHKYHTDINKPVPKDGPMHVFRASAKHHKSAKLPQKHAHAKSEQELIHARLNILGQDK